MHVHLSFPELAAAAGAGVVHALVPCGHSWPVLVPVAARLGAVGRVSFWYGLGVLIGATTLGIATGGGGGFLMDLFSSRVGMWIEEGLGVAMILVGVAIMAKTRLAHTGHVHGACAPKEADGAPPPCGHKEHGVANYRRYGTNGGLLLLGLVSVTAPCFSNLTAGLLAVAKSEPIAGAAIFAVYGLFAAITNDVVLRSVKRGRSALSVLSSPKFETILLRISGAVLAAYGVLMFFHIGHDHAHG
jgi:hypothetical protein